MGRGRTRQDENAAVRGGSASPRRHGGRRESAERKRDFRRSLQWGAAAPGRMKMRRFGAGGAPPRRRGGQGESAERRRDFRRSPRWGAAAPGTMKMRRFGRASLHRGGAEGTGKARRRRKEDFSKEGSMCPVCIANTAAIVAGAGTTGGILAVCIGRFRRFFKTKPSQIVPKITGERRWQL